MVPETPSHFPFERRLEVIAVEESGERIEGGAASQGLQRVPLDDDGIGEARLEVREIIEQRHGLGCDTFCVVGESPVEDVFPSSGSLASKSVGICAHLDVGAAHSGRSNGAAAFVDRLFQQSAFRIRERLLIANRDNTSLRNFYSWISPDDAVGFQEQKIGVAIINLLRGLAVFDGLGDSELRKVARLFTQKLYRPGEKVFARGDSGSEAYVVMRGQIEIHLDDKSPPIATIGNGQIFGELSFLDGAPRVANAIASQARRWRPRALVSRPRWWR